MTLAERQVEPVRFDVIRNALVEVTEEMSLSLSRSAYSTNIKTRLDFSCAMFDRELRHIAQAMNEPSHLGALSVFVPMVVREYGADRLGPGDAILTNDPASGGVHLNDVTLITPVHYDGVLFGYLASLAHHVDVGGGAPASVGCFREIFQEGVIIPPVKLIHAGVVSDDLFRLVLSQIRSKRETAGDLRAQAAANNTGARRLHALIDRYRLDTLNHYIDEIIGYTERRTRAELAKIPPGVASASGQLDCDGFDGPPVALEAKVIADDDGVLIDLSGSEVQRAAPVNSTYSQTYSACAYVIKCLAGTDVPINAGFHSMVRVIAPEGTVVNRTHPAPVVGGWETAMRLSDVILKALAELIPDRVPAGSKAMVCHAGFGGIDPRTGDYFCFLETIAGGHGARAGSDGPDAVQTNIQNTQNAPVEETESNYPVRILRYELIADSEGAGRTRGGLGLRRDYTFPFGSVSFSILADRDREGPWGLHGGLPGAKARYVLTRDGQETELRAKTTLVLSPSDVLSYQTCGGGGYGSPTERAPEHVLEDVHEGKISLERARSVYGMADGDPGSSSAAAGEAG